MQWMPPPPFHDVERVDLKNVAARKAFRDRLARFFVVRIIEGRHHHAAIGEVEIDIACGERPPARIGALLARLEDLDHIEAPSFGVARLAEPADRFAHRLVIGMGARGRHADDHAARRCETGDVVDMAVGFLIRETLAQPDHAARAGEQRQAFLHLLPVEMRIAVGIKEALLGRDQRAFAVDVNCTAFADQRRAIRAHAGLRHDPPGQRRVICIRMVFVAPGIEAPCDTRTRPVRPQQKGRPHVARPGIVERHFEDRHLARTGEFDFGPILGTHRDRHGLEGGHRTCHARIGLLGPQQALRPAPYLRPARPAHPGARVRRPFRRHRVAVTHGAWVVGIEPFYHASL